MVVSRKCWQKNWNFGGFMKCKNKINWNHLLARLGPRGGAEAGAEREARSGGRSGGPRAQPVSLEVSTFFLLSIMNTTHGIQVFCAKIFVNTAKKFKKSMNTRSQNKKNMRGLCWNPALVIFRTRMQLYSLTLLLLILVNITNFYTVFTFFCLAMPRKSKSKK